MSKIFIGLIKFNLGKRYVFLNLNTAD